MKAIQLSCDSKNREQQKSVISVDGGQKGTQSRLYRPPSTEMTDSSVRLTFVLITVLSVHAYIAERGNCTHSIAIQYPCVLKNSLTKFHFVRIIGSSPKS